MKLLQCNQNCIHLSPSVCVCVSLSLSLFPLIICLSVWLAVILSLCFPIRPVNEWVKRWFDDQAVPGSIPAGSGDGNLFKCKRGFSESVESVSEGFPTYSSIAHCLPLPPSHRPDVNEII